MLRQQTGDPRGVRGRRQDGHASHLPPPSPPPARGRVRAELRFYRTRAGLSQKDLAARPPSRTT